MTKGNAAAEETTTERTITIEAIGAAGDGIADADDIRFFVPQAAPGDRMRVRVEGKRGSGFAARPLELLSAGADRVEPPCPHFGPCGGCLLQHVADAPYRAWKQRLVVDALARRGFEGIPVDMPIATPLRSRRRATFAARRLKKGVALGFVEHRGARIVDLQSCLILRPEIVTFLPSLRATFDQLLSEGEPAEAAVTVLDEGLDVVLGLPRTPDLGSLECLAAFADACDLARLSWRLRSGRASDRAGPVEPISHRRAGTVSVAGFVVAVPPGGFLQASVEGEAILTSLVGDAVGGAGRIADLYCGIGTFALPLALSAQVLAVDSNGLAVSALQAARAEAGGGRPASGIDARLRDLDRSPLAGRELSGFEAVVFDPPRRGARAQAESLAASTVPVVVAVSCNPASFGRDARILVDGGFRLERVTPVDQFLWSAHVEIVGHFSR